MEDSGDGMDWQPTPHNQAPLTGNNQSLWVNRAVIGSLLARAPAHNTVPTRPLARSTPTNSISGIRTPYTGNNQTPWIGRAAVNSLLASKAPALHTFPISSLAHPTPINSIAGIPVGPDVLRVPFRIHRNAPVLPLTEPASTDRTVPLIANYTSTYHQERLVAAGGRRAFFEVAPARRRSFDEFAENEDVVTQTNQIRIPGSFPADTPPQYRQRAPDRTGLLPLPLMPGQTERSFITDVTTTCNAVAGALSNIALHSSRQIVYGLSAGAQVAYHNKRRVIEATRGARIAARRGGQIAVQTFRAVARSANIYKRRLVEFVVVRRPDSPALNPATVPMNARATEAATSGPAQNLTNASAAESTDFGELADSAESAELATPDLSEPPKVNLFVLIESQIGSDNESEESGSETGSDSGSDSGSESGSEDWAREKDDGDLSMRLEVPVALNYGPRLLDEGSDHGQSQTIEYQQPAPAPSVPRHDPTALTLCSMNLFMKHHLLEDHLEDYPSSLSDASIVSDAETVLPEAIPAEDDVMEYHETAQDDSGTTAPTDTVPLDVISMGKHSTGDYEVPSCDSSVLSDALTVSPPPEIKKKKSVRFFASPNSGAPVNSVKYIEEDSLADTTVDSSDLPEQHDHSDEESEVEAAGDDDMADMRIEFSTAEDLQVSWAGAVKVEQSPGDALAGRVEEDVEPTEGMVDEQSMDIDDQVSRVVNPTPDRPTAEGSKIFRAVDMTCKAVVGLFGRWAPNRVRDPTHQVLDREESSEAKIEEETIDTSSAVDVKHETSPQSSITSAVRVEDGSSLETSIITAVQERLFISPQRTVRREREAAEELQRKEDEAAIMAQLEYETKVAEKRAAIARAEAEAKRNAEEAERKLRAEAAAAQASWLTKMGRKIVPADTTLIQPLSAVWERQLNEGMRQRPTDQLATVSTGTVLRRRDFGTVLPRSGDNPSGWLNDDMVLAYLQLLIDWALKRCDHKRNDTPKFHAFTHFLYHNLAQDGYQKVARWAGRAKLGGKKLLEAEYIFFPVNTGNHWTLIVVSPTRKTIEYYDSMNPQDDTSHPKIATIKLWLRGELGADYRDQEWTTRAVAGPQQENMNDCGVFTVTTAKMILTGWEPKGSYRAVHIPNQRKRMLVELMKGSLDGEFAPVIGGAGGSPVVETAPVPIATGAARSGTGTGTLRRSQRRASNGGL
ncbi:hypothetical protein MMC13_003383 [Lambiella insularis]|nr:hypothetical protein [Lambiella insularis]